MEAPRCFFVEPKRNLFPAETQANSLLAAPVGARPPKNRNQVQSRSRRALQSSKIAPCWKRFGALIGVLVWAWRFRRAGKSFVMVIFLGHYCRFCGKRPFSSAKQNMFQ